MEIVLIGCIIIIAFLYSSAGQGGASGYLALMAFFCIAPVYMKTSALLLSVFVSLIAFISYYKAGYFKVKLLIPFVLTSIPMAFLGAKLNVNPHTYKMVLGFILILATICMLYKPSETKTIKAPSFLIAMTVGAAIGFLSGITGIGGGIILSPLILLLNWASIKETAAVSSIFIFLNSISGLTGTWYGSFVLPPEIIYWVLAGLAGGIAGGYAGSRKFTVSWSKYVLSAVLLIAGIKLLLVY